VDEKSRSRVSDERRQECFGDGTSGRCRTIQQNLAREFRRAVAHPKRGGWADPLLVEAGHRGERPSGFSRLLPNSVASSWQQEWYEALSRRWEPLFSFDLAVYRRWARGATVWLDEDPDDQNGGSDGFTFSPGFHQKSGKSENEDAGHNGHDCSIKEICTDQSTHLHRFPGTESLPAGAGDAAFSVCEIHDGENIPDIPEEIRPIREPAASGGFSRCKSGCKDVKTGVNVQPPAPVNPADYIALPAAKDEPCHVCGRRPTSSVKRGGGVYLCYDCLKKAERPAKV